MPGLCHTSTLGMLSALAVLVTSDAALAQQATLERAKRVGEIKVCVDQDNLPYSSEKMSPPGFDVEVAQEIAKGLGIRLGYTWFATNNGKRALRQLVGDANCDFFLGLPADENFEDNNFKLILTKPYYTGGFATLVRSDAPNTALVDAKSKGVGVLMGTISDFKLFDKGYERKLYRNTTEVFEAVAHKDIDAAVAPAPEVAWMAKSSSQANLKVLANTEKEFIFPMAIGVRKADKDLRDEISAIVEQLHKNGRLAEIFNKYGMVTLTADAADAPAAAPAPAEPAKAPEAPAAAPKPEEKKSEAAPAKDDPAAAMEADFPSDPETIDKGRRMYKQACYKCHGPNGVSGGTIPDLRKYVTTHDPYEMFGVIQGGRLDKGMPAWNDYLNETEIKEIIVYVRSLPKD